MLDSVPSGDQTTAVSLILGGGIALGAYEAGVYAALHEDAALHPSWVAGASIGSVNAAIIAGNAPAERVPKLRAFWAMVASTPLPMTSFWLGHPATGPWRQTQNEASAFETFVFGRDGIFRPRVAPGQRAGVPDVTAMYDLAPLGQRLPKFVDFDRINGGDVRFSLGATDVVSGERVVFDTGRGHKIGPEHILASSALMPVFAPIEIEGRLLADGALSANTPLDLVLDEPEARDRLCIVVDLFARQGSRPHTLAAATARAGGLMFGNQTRRLLEGRQREHEVRELLDRLVAAIPAELREQPDVARIVKEASSSQTSVLYLGYRAGVDEVGQLKGFDFSHATLADRWEAGGRAARTAVQTFHALTSKRGLTVIEVENGSQSMPADTLVQVA